MQSELTIKLTKALAKPFDPTDIEWRIQSAGKKNGKEWAVCLAYVTNRAIMERLDEAVGIDGWQNEFKPLASGGNLCGISIKFGDEWVTKWDGAENTDREAVKGGISGAMKRTAVQWGIGRYLYNLKSGFATIMPKGQGEFTNGKYKDKESGKSVYFEWNPPALPKWALPEGVEPERTPPPKPDDVKGKARAFLEGHAKRLSHKIFVDLLGIEGYNSLDDLMEKDIDEIRRVAETIKKAEVK